ncbi:unnamed protein product [Polarella glacialis]|uniref:Major facilitator superfamily (MFS) profile domain-containing protein n=2 Tax=Polarella glacialis TaxID=89957 RepID=A0A813HUD1_POLGL|nr:unnamed protein product [Polarella glacialis]
MVNGAGLGLVQPLLLSLVSDTNAPSRRGTAFGLLQFTGNLGTMGGGYLSTILAPTLIMGMLGWRFVFIVFGMLSALVGIALVSFIGEPRKQAFNETSLLSIIRAKAPEMLAIMRIPTFLLIIGQGVAGTAPWFAFSYLSIWLELGCFSHSETAGINSFFVLGQAAAGLLGGKLLDVVASRYPDHGPAWLCQFSVGIGLPLFAFIFFGLKDNTSATMMVPFCATFALAGSLVAWCGIANNKIFGDIVPQSVYTYVFSLDRAVEGAFGALGTPAVGLVTERVFSFDQSAVTSGACSPKDAASLGSGIFWVCMVCWSACFLFYCGLHYTYPRDRIRSQKQQVMLESSDSEDESSQSAGD